MWSKILLNRPFLRRNSTLIALALGAFVLYHAFVASHVPHDHDVIFHVKNPGSLRLLRAEWSSEDSTQLAAGSARFFEQGDAPPSVRVTVRLPNGIFMVDVHLEYANAESVEFSQQVTLGDQPTIVNLPAPANPGSRPSVSSTSLSPQPSP